MPPDIAYKPSGTQPKHIFPGGTLTPAKFLPSYYEWLAYIGEQKILYKIIATGTASDQIYEVPEGFAFFITSWTLCAHSDPGIVTDKYIYLTALPKVGGIGFDDYKIFAGIVMHNEKINSQLSNNLSIPIRVNGDEQIRIAQTGDTDAIATIQGFLIEIKNIPII